MSSLRPAFLGPIVGHVTATSARLWIRAGDTGDEGGSAAPNRRTVGVIAVRRVDGKRPASQRAYYFRLQREFDRTGYFTFGEDGDLGDGTPSPALEADKSYEVRVGTLTVDDPNPEGESIPDEKLAERLPPAKVWLTELDALPDDSALAAFRTPPVPEAPGALSFIVGSCRYPGLLWKAKKADEIFGPMLAEAMGRSGRRAVELALMVGDQIYADKANRNIPLERADTFEEFQERYRTAFGSRNMRAFLRQVPTYMILDDHEIEDNWVQDRVNYAEERFLFSIAINAYMSYQWLHGPRNYGRRLFYDFECAGYPFFAMDSRTQRFMDDVKSDLDDNHLLGRPALAREEPSQLDIFLHWLREQQAKRGDVPKFIVSPSVFAPNPITARQGRAGTKEQKVEWMQGSDSWPAFPTTRRAVLECIVANQIQNVVFLSGDIHCSNVAELSFSGSAAAAQLKAFSITSSAFYWPFPFADGDPSGYVHDSRAPGQEDTFVINAANISLDYKAFAFTQEDNFCRVDVDHAAHQLRVVPYGDEGEQLTSGGFLGIGTKPIVSVLQLAPW